jgi:hypothetical protein
MKSKLKHTQQKNINIPYYCNICKTINNKWNPVYYQTEGQMLIPLKDVYVGICEVCGKIKTTEIYTKMVMIPK